MSDPLDFTGQRVLVIGGSSGIGHGMARAFVARGGHVEVWGTRGSARDYEGEAGADFSGLTYAQVDVADRAALTSACARFNRLDVAVLAQGIVRYRRGEFDMEGFDSVMEVNLTSMMGAAMALYPALKAAGGRLITVSSTAAFHATRGNPAYNASKAGLVGLTRTLGDAWARDGIRVNGIAPGLVATKLTKVTTEDPARLEGALANIPLGRLGTPDDMAGAALFLASPLSGYIIGQTLIVDGGLLLR